MNLVWITSGLSGLKTYSFICRSVAGALFEIVVSFISAHSLQLPKMPSVYHSNRCCPCLCFWLYEVSTPRSIVAVGAWFQVLHIYHQALQAILVCPSSFSFYCYFGRFQRQSWPLVIMLAIVTYHEDLACVPLLYSSLSRSVFFASIDYYLFLLC